MYQVLYRKYRPKVFADVYGQEHVTSTLLNEIQNGRVSHAYLFTGSRGTGKTTCAKILAKAVNCEHSHNGEPCNECEVCRGLDNGSIYDVVEIDAASNNGVDNIRNLREEANYTPARGKYRVYIIDEVHMLSQGAYNALLKTLEEPPAHVIFILATTEVNMIPATILSRCQRFDFKRIQPETMAKRLRQVAELEGLSLQDEAAILIARIADGALRDGLSILDQCAGRSKEITETLVSEVAGIAGREAMFQLSDCIAAGDSNGAVNVVSDLYQNSFDMERLCAEMIQHFRNFLIVKTVKNSRNLVICTDDEYRHICEAAKKYTIESVLHTLDVFQTTLIAIKGGATARIEMEMALIKLCEPKMDESNASVLSRLSKVERAIKNGTGAVTFDETPQTPQVQPTQPESKPASAAPQKTKEAAPPAQEAVDVQEQEMQTAVVERTMQETPAAPVEPPKPVAPVREATPASQPTAPATDAEPEDVPFEGWDAFMDIIHRDDIPLYGILSGSSAVIRGEWFLIQPRNEAIKTFIKSSNHSRAIRKALYELTGIKYKLGIKNPPAESTAQRDPLEDLIAKASNHIEVDVK